MKYCVYDKAADGYLTKMVFDGGLSNDTQFECGLNEYITNAKLLDTKKAAVDTIARIESFKFMEKGRFVVHQFDDTLVDQYIISEAGNPTKVVDNITVDLDGNINVKYGTMACHWSTTSLIYVINKLNKFQDASAPTRYCSWNATFDIYKVITVIDERECTHYQFIKVTEKGLEEYKKDEEDKLRVAGNNIVNVTACLNKRIEDLENANYDLGRQVTARGIVANRLQEENDNLKAKVESIKKEARHWKTMYESASADNTFPCIAASALEEVNDKNDALADMLKEITNCIADIMAATRTMDNDVMISNLRDVSCKIGVKTIDDGPIYGISVILNILIRKIKEAIEWKRRAEEAICDYTKCNEALGEWKKKCRAKDTDYEVLKNKLKACEIILESTQSSLTAAIKERDKTLEQKEFYKRQANSVYGMTIPGRCNGKQMFCDITTGKKILVDKEKYDDLVECVNNINTTYEILKCADFTMNKPIWFDGVITRIKNLTK